MMVVQTTRTTARRQPRYRSYRVVFIIVRRGKDRGRRKGEAMEVDSNAKKWAYMTHDRTILLVVIAKDGYTSIIHTTLAYR